MKLLHHLLIQITNTDIGDGMKYLFVMILSLTSFSALGIRPEAPSVSPFITKNYNKLFLSNPVFEGIVAFSNCSGSLVKFNGAPENKKAIVMTNGHCLSGLKNNEVRINTAASLKVAVFDHQMKRFPLELKKVLYATMIDTDVSFFEANLTYHEIETNYGIEALIIQEEIVAIQTPISIVSGYWETLTSCEAESIVPILREDEWIWKNSIRYSNKCMTKGGFSGSPVIALNTRLVVGIHNTGNNGKLDCSDMNPCEQNENGEIIFHVPNRRYAQ